MNNQALEMSPTSLLPKPGIKSAVPDLRETIDRQTRFQEVIHSNHWRERVKIINALSDPLYKSLNPSARRMAACGQGASFYIDPTSENVRPWLSRCGHRLCPFCSNARSANTADQLMELMVEHHADRTIILTIRSCDLPLDLQIASLLHCFKRLRSRASWKRHIKGGVRVLEITRNAQTGLWHPHLHILTHGSYYPHAELSKQWRQITDGSNVVWVSKVSDVKGMAAELAKYIGKPQRIAELDAREIREYAYATKGVRMVQTFGDLHGRKPQDQDKPEKAPGSRARVRLSTLLHLARSGADEAIVLLTWLAKKYKVFGRYVYLEMPQLTPDPGGYDHAMAALAIIRGEAPKKPDWTTADIPDDIDHKICQAYTCYKARLDAGAWSNVDWFYQTETERLGKTWKQ